MAVWLFGTADTAIYLVCSFSDSMDSIAKERQTKNI